MNGDQEQFLKAELFSLTLMATVQRAGVYSHGSRQNERKKFQDSLRSRLEKIVESYANQVTEKHHPPENRQAELVAAEPARLQDPVEPGRGELAVEFGGVVAEAFGLVLLVADGRDQRPGPLDDRLRRQVRLRDGDFLRSHLGVP